MVLLFGRATILKQKKFTAVVLILSSSITLSRCACFVERTLLGLQSRRFVRSKTFIRLATRTILRDFHRTTRMSLLPTNPVVEHVSDSLLPDWMRKERTRVLVHGTIGSNSSAGSVSGSGGKSVVYWMQRDVRTVDNCALSFASHLACSRGVPLRVVYALPPPPPPALPTVDSIAAGQENLPPTLINMPMTARHGQFLLGGLECVYAELKEKKIPLHVILPASHDVVGETVCHAILDTFQAQAVVCDFSPLRHHRQWVEIQAAPFLNQAVVPLYQVDAHNIVPVWMAADKRQVGARTLRPRIHRVIQDYLAEAIPKLGSNEMEVPLPEFERGTFESFLQMDHSVPVIDWATPGTSAGMKQFDMFLKHGLKKYETMRNDPTEKTGCSHLSPWINHGHISFQPLMTDVKKLNKYASGVATFIEEGVVRRELSDNYLYYSPNDYDSLSAGAGWAQETLDLHASDPRDYIYSLAEFENGQTHDDLWNAAQLQVVRTGKMHGFLRMYWAKKILEWTESPSVALVTAQYLNDKYALDGRDANGFVGVAWSVMGIHDMGWKERPIFGKIRFMNYEGCKRKFKVPVFVSQYKGAAENAANALKKKMENKKRPARTLGAPTAVVSKKDKKRRS